MALYVIYLNDKAQKAPFLKIGCHLWMPLEKTSFMDAPVHGFRFRLNMKYKRVQVRVVLYLSPNSSDSKGACPVIE